MSVSVPEELPDSIITKEVVGTYVNMYGQAASGQVIFTIDETLYHAQADLAVIPQSVAASLDGSGDISIRLPATNQSAFQNPFVYHVTEAIDGAEKRRYTVAIPQNQAEPINLLALAPATPPSPSTAYLSQAFADIRFVRNITGAPGLMVLESDDPVPPGTPVGTVILRRG